MKIYKIKNKYQVRKMIKGKSYYLFFNTKPTQKEIKYALIEKIKLTQEQGRAVAGSGTGEPLQEQEQEKKTLVYFVSEYIKNKTDVLSPSTIKGYKNILQQFIKTIPTLKLKDINNDTLQKYINQMTLKKRDVKTIKNQIGLITATMTYNGLYKKYFLKYPHAIKKEPYIPTDEDIQKLNNYFSHTKYYTFFRLCLYGLRVSEILALTINDIKPNGELLINKAKVENDKGELITKTTKTEKSKRVIKIDLGLATQIIKRGYIIKHTYRQYIRASTAAMIKLNITHFSPHKLRHYIASKMHLLNIPSKYIQAFGGWASDNILKSVYTHAIDQEKSKYFEIVNQELNKIIK